MEFDVCHCPRCPINSTVTLDTFLNIVVAEHGESIAALICTVLLNVDIRGRLYASPPGTVQLAQLRDWLVDEKNTDARQVFTGRKWDRMKAYTVGVPTQAGGPTHVSIPCKKCIAENSLHTMCMQCSETILAKHLYRLVECDIHTEIHYIC